MEEKGNLPRLIEKLFDMLTLGCKETEKVEYFAHLVQVFKLKESKLELVAWVYPSFKDSPLINLKIKSLPLVF